MKGNKKMKGADDDVTVRLSELQSMIDNQNQLIDDLRRKVENSNSLYIKILIANALCAILIAVFSLSHPATAQSDGPPGDFLKRLEILEGKTRYQSINGSTTLFTGTNVQIVSGSGQTDGWNGKRVSVNGLGNLIIGYNEDRDDYPRTGSHNLIVGSNNGYSSFGGIVAGRENVISNWFAVITGGRNNKASGRFASVSGGDDNVASGDVSWTGGGNRNIASGTRASVSGGQGNEARKTNSSVSGGYLNKATAFGASVSGGVLNRATGEGSWVGGGYKNQASGKHASVAGGRSEKRVE